MTINVKRKEAKKPKVPISSISSAYVTFAQGNKWTKLIIYLYLKIKPKTTLHCMILKQPLTNSRIVLNIEPSGYFTIQCHKLEGLGPRALGCSGTRISHNISLRTIVFLQYNILGPKFLFQPLFSFETQAFYFIFRLFK